MINSLSKDSHMGPSFCPPILYSGRGAYKPQVNIVTQNKSDPRISVTINKPAEVNFCGFSSSRLANDDTFKELIRTTRIFLGHEKLPKTKNLIQKTKNFFTNRKKHKELTTFINNLVHSLIYNDKTISIKDKESLEPGIKEVNEFITSNKADVERFLGLHQDNLQTVIKRTKEILIDEHQKDPLDAKNLVRKTKNAINTALGAYPAVEKQGKLFTSETLRKFFIMADNSQSVFGALFALILTGIFRPATIMALPGQKKNKDDKKYAAAHSVASGLIGYGIALIISSPIAKAMKKLEDEPDKFLTKYTVRYLRKKGAVNTAKKYVNILHEVILAFPRAAITIALIPPILKHVFGYELKKNKTLADNTKTPKDFNGGSEK